MVNRTTQSVSGSDVVSPRLGLGEKWRRKGPNGLRQFQYSQSVDQNATLRLRDWPRGEWVYYPHQEPSRARRPRSHGGRCIGEEAAPRLRGRKPPAETGRTDDEVGEGLGLNRRHHLNGVEQTTPSKHSQPEKKMDDRTRPTIGPMSFIHGRVPGPSTLPATRAAADGQRKWRAMHFFW